MFICQVYMFKFTPYVIYPERPEKYVNNLNTGLFKAAKYLYTL